MKHENYEILNLIGYGLSKFNDDFISWTEKEILSKPVQGELF